jgi:hypothetical protein
MKRFLDATLRICLSVLPTVALSLSLLLSVQAQDRVARVGVSALPRSSARANLSTWNRWWIRFCRLSHDSPSFEVMP